MELVIEISYSYNEHKEKLISELHMARFGCQNLAKIQFARKHNFYKSVARSSPLIFQLKSMPLIIFRNCNNIYTMRSSQNRE